MSISIRRGDIQDVYNISELNKKCLPIYYSQMECFMTILSLKYIVLVAEMNNKLVGYMIGELNPDKKNYHIMSIGVDEIYRSIGIGSLLLTYVTNIIKKECNNITLYVHTENTKGVQFYEKNGFDNIETLKDYYAGSLKSKSQDAYKMKKNIS